MRVITGTARGRRLRTLEGNDVRPTTEKVKEAMFSAIQFDLDGARVLDLFAGSGQLGIEALSRGAEHAVFVDASTQAAAIVRENLENTQLSDRALVVNRRAEDYLRTCTAEFDFAFLDPPYRNGILEELLPILAKKLSNGGKIFCEHESDLVLPEKICGLVLKKVYKYGKIKLALYCKTEESDEQ
ncbi:MAG: 16S rRNA (guanine(966)-N(2))-methyltransferase RsmD [Ruminococcus sp.]|nr:16S rRNA (guanine(966)-N(2))-methyltransferase RsmD [Ruminococcus sp.]